MAEKKHIRQSTVNDFDFSLYVKKVLKTIHPDTGISGVALSTMVNLVKVGVAKIVYAMNQISIRSGAKTVTSRDVQSATKLVLPGELAKGAVTQGTGAITQYTSTKGGAKSAPVQRKTRAGLTFNVTRIERLMMLSLSANRKGATAAVYLTAVIEYLCAEVLELAGNAARDFKKIRITPRHIKIAIANDIELFKMYKNVILSGGVIPNIHHKLLPEKQEKKEEKEEKVIEIQPKKSKKEKLKEKVVKTEKTKKTAKIPKVNAASPK